MHSAVYPLMECRLPISGDLTWKLTMADLLLTQILFAEDVAVPNATPNAGLFQLYFMGGAIILLFYFLMLRPNQRRERDRKNMLAALKKNDHVVTIGGIKGVVANVKAEDDEVVLRVDDDSGTKLRVILSSIARVVTAAEESAGAKKES